MRGFHCRRKGAKKLCCRLDDLLEGETLLELQSHLFLQLSTSWRICYLVDMLCRLNNLLEGASITSLSSTQHILAHLTSRGYALPSRRLNRGGVRLYLFSFRSVLQPTRQQELLNIFPLELQDLKISSPIQFLFLSSSSSVGHSLN